MDHDWHMAVRPDVQGIKDEVQMTKNQHMDDVVEKDGLRGAVQHLSSLLDDRNAEIIRLSEAFINAAPTAYIEYVRETTP